jgi:hypothetical protein
LTARWSAPSRSRSLVARPRAHVACS